MFAVYRRPFWTPTRNCGRFTAMISAEGGVLDEVRM